MAGKNHVTDGQPPESDCTATPGGTVATSTASHRGSHSTLLRRYVPGPPRTLHAIVVPTIHAAERLLPAFKLAAALNCRVVALCSGALRRHQAVHLARAIPGVRCIAIDLPTDYSHPLLSFRTAGNREAVVPRLIDLSLKRNLGLLLARLSGWASILFMDDDIREIHPAAVRRAISGLGRHNMVGFRVPDYPDNSVVCHANRLAGQPQDVFVSGSALAVDCRQIDAFFPQVYNEDWLFLCEALRRGMVTRTGRVQQVPYDPFGDPARATAEEFGDVLAEGLVNLIHDRIALERTDLEYWRGVLLRRGELIRRTGERLANLPTGGVSSGTALLALQAAEQRRASISATLLHGYVADWRRDLRSWREMMRDLRPLDSVPKALADLGLGDAATSTDTTDRHRDRRSTVIAGAGLTVRIGPPRRVARATRTAAVVGD